MDDFLNANERDPAESPTPGRRQQSGPGAVFGLLLPVVLGGVTVFGIYFLFLEDRLKPAPQVSTEPPPEKTVPEKAEAPAPPIRPRQSAVVPQKSANEPPTKEPIKSKTEPADKEKSAENTLGLAQQMLKTNPSAAPDWFRKVVDQYPGTKAAEKAQAWLKQRSAGGP